MSEVEKLEVRRVFNAEEQARLIELGEAVAETITAHKLARQKQQRMLRVVNETATAKRRAMDTLTEFLTTLADKDFAAQRDEDEDEDREEDEDEDIEEDDDY